MELRGDSRTQLYRQQILIVDDDADTCLLFQLVLELEGAQVTTAPSVAQALQVLSERKIDLLISDLGLPDRDGWALLTDIRRQEQGQEHSLCAIAVTATAGADIHEQTRAAGFNLCLIKPIDLEEFVQAVVELTRSNA